MRERAEGRCARYSRCCSAQVPDAAGTEILRVSLRTSHSRQSEIIVKARSNLVALQLA